MTTRSGKPYKMSVPEGTPPERGADNNDDLNDSDKKYDVLVDLIKTMDRSRLQSDAHTGEAVATMVSEMKNAQREREINRELPLIPSTDGSNPKDFIAWYRAIEKSPITDTESHWQLARLASRGLLREAISRSSVKSWKVIKEDLASSFLPVTVTEQKQMELESITQKPKESVLQYLQRFELLVSESYLSTPTSEEEVRRLSKLLGKGLSSDSMREKLINKGWPRSIGEACQRLRHAAEKAARKEQLSSNNNNPIPGSYKSGKSSVASESQNSELTKQIKELTAQVTMLTAQAQREKLHSSKPASASANSDRRTCYRCGHAGHIAQYCKASAPQAQQSSHKCDRCRRVGHETKHCTAPAPKRACFCGQKHWSYDCPSKSDKSLN